MKTASYHVLGPLMGGYGSQAFLGQEIRPNGVLRPVVMVFLPEEVIEDKEHFQAVLEETRLAIRMDHLNVIAVYGLTELEEGYARIVEFADAESLRAVFSRTKELDQKIPLPIATTLLVDACMGVHYAHQLGVSHSGKPLLHRGIRPETLLVSFRGIAKVTGFGAGTMADLVSRLGQERSIRDPYTAPEQIFGGRMAATIQTDVYALGAVLYETLTGKPPFAPDAQLEKSIIKTHPSYKKLTETAPPELADIVMRAMIHSSHERFSSALEFGQKLIQLNLGVSRKEIAQFMEDLFPKEMVQRKARNALLSHGQQATQPEMEAESEAVQAQEKSSEEPKLPNENKVVTVTKSDSTKKRLPVQTRPRFEPKQPTNVWPKRVFWLTVLILLGMAGWFFATIDGFTRLWSQINNLVQNDQPELSQTKSAAPTPSPPHTPDPTKFKQTSQSLVEETTKHLAPKIENTPKVKSPQKKAPVKKSPSTARDNHSLTSEVSSKSGILVIQTLDQSKVYIDGKYKGKAPLGKIRLSSGQHHIEVRHAETGATYQQKVNIRAGVEHTLTVGFYQD